MLTVWLFFGLISLLVGYGAFRITRQALLKFRPRGHSDGQQCVVCGYRGDDLQRCDECGRYVCKQHVITYSKGTEQELITLDRRGTQYYKERSLPPGHKCPACDNKRLIAVIVGIVIGNVAFVGTMGGIISIWVLSH
jgi:hypothetical protein